MEIKYNTQKQVWNRYILDHNPWSIFQLFEWGEIHEKVKGSVYRITFEDHGAVIGQAQVLVVKAKRGTFLHVRHGPVFADFAPELFQAFKNELIKVAQKEKAWFIRISPMISDSSVNNEFMRTSGFIPSPMHAMDAEVCWVLDLNKSEDELLSNMRKTTRYLVRQAEKVGVQIHKSTQIKDFMSLYSVTAERHKFVTHKGVEHEYDLFQKEDKVLLLTATHEKKLIASALILFLGKQAIYHHGASIPSKIPASYLLQWYAIKEAKRRKCEIYNFWGIAPFDKPKHPWRGITLFKQGFGGRELRFLHALDLPTSPLYYISATIEHIRKLVRGY